MNSKTAKKIQYRWERISRSTATDYMDGREIARTWFSIQPAWYIDFGTDGYFMEIYGVGSTKYQYAIDGEKILFMVAGPTRATTPKYTDTAFVKYVDDHLLILSSRDYFISPGYNYIKETIDSLKR